MSLVQGFEIAKSYDCGLTYVFHEVNFTIDAGKHLAIVGANGSGKSTLLRIIAGCEESEGLIQMKRGLRISYQMQEPTYATQTVRQVLEECHGEILELQKRIQELEVQMAAPECAELETVLSEYGQLVEQFELRGGYTYEQEMLRVVTGLGLTATDLERLAANLSGGEKSKLLLATQLLAGPDLLLLDEPTNHLDLDSLEWLEGFIRGYRGTCIIVSHDRYFLDQVAEEVWEIERGQLQVYSGNYTQYLTEKERRLKFQWLEYEKQQKEIHHLTEQAHDQRIYATRAEKMADYQEGEPNYYRRKAAKVMKKAKVAEAKRDKLLNAKNIEKPFEKTEIKLRFPVEVRSSGLILHVKDLSGGYPPAPPLFQGLSFDLTADERLGVIGPNGAGKTTLFKMILGEMQPLAGEVARSGRMKIGYYSQGQETLDEEKSALENILTTCPVDETVARTMLGCLKIEKEKVHLPVKLMSGGEKGKVQLCKILLSGANLLVLDEPTNHLDIDCREAVEQALLQYPGAILFISHDRYFIRKLATALVYLSAEELRVHYGDYDSFKNGGGKADTGAGAAANLLRETRRAALLGKLSLLRPDEVAEKERLEAELLALAREQMYQSE